MGGTTAEMCQHGLYEFRLGLLYSHAKRFDDAKMAFDRGSRRKARPCVNTSTAMRSWNWQRAIYRKHNHVTKGSSRLSGLVFTIFQSWPVSLSKQKYARLSRTSRIPTARTTSRTYAFLATCSHQLGLDKETIEYMNKALAADPSMAGYRNG